MSGGIYRPSGEMREKDFERNGIENAGLGLYVIQGEVFALGVKGKAFTGSWENKGICYQKKWLTE